MGDHRKLRRARGLVVRVGGGRRRRSGLLEDQASPRELNRAARRAVRGEARRRILFASLGAVILIAAAVAVSLIVISRPTAGPAGEAPPPASGASVLIAVTGDGGRAVSLALIGADPDGALIALFPPGLLTVLPGFGDRQISDSTRFGAANLPELTVSNLLGVRVDGSVQITAGELTALLGSGLDVDLTSPLVVEVGSGEVVAMDVGSALRSQDDVERILTEQGTGTQLEWLDRQGSVWRAIFSRMASQPALVDQLVSRVLGDPALARQALLGAVQSKELQLTAVPVERIERAGGDSEMYQIGGDAAAAFASGRFAYLQFTAKTRPRVEVLNGNGRIGTTRPVAAALIRHGFRIVRTDNADKSTYAETRIIAQGREHQQAALDARKVLGRGEVVVEVRQPSGVVDLTIIVGQDIPAEEV
ncbi:MAG: LytR C-terminal domain-containing protein [Actinobacteria bacterium]|nr:LytR C-terminal domain-containing protein [Actinomycetota bacterium]